MKGRRNQRILMILIGLLAVIMILCCAGGIFRVGTVCERDIIHERDEAVKATPLLEMDLPATVDLTKWENNQRAWMSPIGTDGVNAFVQRLSSVSEARAKFEGTCENGWIQPDWNAYNREGLTFGGAENNRYCATQAVEWRYD